MSQDDAAMLVFRLAIQQLCNANGGEFKVPLPEKVEAGGTLVYRFDDEGLHFRVLPNSTGKPN